MSIPSFMGPDGIDVLPVRSLYDSTEPPRHTATSVKASQRAANAAASAGERREAERGPAAAGEAREETAAGGSAAAAPATAANDLPGTISLSGTISLATLLDKWETEVKPRDDMYGDKWRRRHQGLDKSGAKKVQNSYCKWLVIIEERNWLMEDQKYSAVEALKALEDELETWKAANRAGNGQSPMNCAPGMGWTVWAHQVVRLRVRGREKMASTPEKKRPRYSKAAETMERNRRARQTAAAELVSDLIA